MGQLINWVEHAGAWAYLAIFLVVSLESAAFLGFLMPGEALVFLGGFLASRGVLDLKLLIALVAVAAILGDSIGYELGRLLRKAWFLRHGRWLGLREEHWQRIEDFFRRHGGKTVFLARFSAFFRILVPFFAGAARLRYLHFLLFNVVGGIVWAAGSVSIGYLAGASWHAVERWVGRTALIVAILVVGVHRGGPVRAEKSVDSISLQKMRDRKMPAPAPEAKNHERHESVRPCAEGPFRVFRVFRGFNLPPVCPFFCPPFFCKSPYSSVFFCAKPKNSSSGRARRRKSAAGMASVSHLAEIGRAWPA